MLGVRFAPLDSGLAAIKTALPPLAVKAAQQLLLPRSTLGGDRNGYVLIISAAPVFSCRDIAGLDKVGYGDLLISAFRVNLARQQVLPFLTELQQYLIFNAMGHGVCLSSG